MQLPLARSTNRLIKSRHYGKILQEYNAVYQRDGKVNSFKFYHEIVKPLIPGYGLGAWYNFLTRFKNATGLMAVTLINEGHLAVDPDKEERVLAGGMLSNDIATRQGIQSALNIGANRLRELNDNPQLMTAKDAIDLLFKAMKAQDSRVAALGKIKADSREEEKFNREFNKAAYG